MKCEDTQELMISCVFEETPPTKSIMLHHHLQSCTPCKSLFLEIQETAEIWEKTSTEPKLDLVTPVMNHLVGAETSGRNSQRPAYQAVKHQIFHFSLAASIALFMFHFGIFEQSGWNVLQMIDDISHKMQDFAQYISS